MRTDKIILWALCAAGAARIFFFSAAFPFFNNVDEVAHFDTIVKYSRGYLPGTGSINFDLESANFIVLYGSPEYMRNPGTAASAVPVPLWRYPAAQLAPHMNEWTATWTRQKNLEANSPPLYYLVAAVWYNVGKIVGLQGAGLLYWLRFLNIPLFVLLFLLTFFFCRHAYKADESMLFGVLLLLAVFPQDVFYSINSDILSPLICLVAYVMLFRIASTERSSPHYLIAGLCIAAAFLTKYSNVPVLLLAAVILLLKVRTWRLTGEGKRHLLHASLFLAGCAVPIAMWLGWNAVHLGEMTGMAGKTHDLGWTLKPIGAILSHPIFSPQGAAHFVAETLRTFWRGEFVWDLRRLASPSADMFYVLSSVVLVLWSVIASLRPHTKSQDRRSRLNLAAALLVGTSFLFLAVCSVVYDFDGCWYPSRQLPYLTSGRLILGVLVPFILVYVDGLRLVLAKIKKPRILIAVAVTFAAMITYSEIQLTLPALSSEYNFFHYSAEPGYSPSGGFPSPAH